MTRGQERRPRLLIVWSTGRGYDAALPDINIIDQKRDKATFYSPTLTQSPLANFRPITFKTPPFNSELFNLSLFKSACGYLVPANLEFFELRPRFGYFLQLSLNHFF